MMVSDLPFTTHHAKEEDMAAFDYVRIRPNFRNIAGFFFRSSTGLENAPVCGAVNSGSLLRQLLKWSIAVSAVLENGRLGCSESHGSGAGPVHPTGSAAETATLQDR
jgi:hypothetical protein